MEKVEKRKGKLHVGTLTKGINTYEKQSKEGRKVTISRSSRHCRHGKNENVLPDFGETCRV